MQKRLSALEFGEIYFDTDPDALEAYNEVSTAILLFGLEEYESALTRFKSYSSLSDELKDHVRRIAENYFLKNKASLEA